ncbi:rhomboid family intramembrane serine protease [Blastococcus sp. Marseille-P5729]|uniref:rhomboid family intramembrane serine protease n=1 Tax=Blastococcus sp. Marseille-P5729 TaxID=2086582 RepID=UPI000D10CD7E|nr:rhomboid family intramembrane serine protease [Blastococcus sp. Marseille-P5729]
MTYPPSAGAPSPSEGYGAPAHCYRHPDRQTGLACTRCERPICPDCLNPAAVGFQCPECVAEGRASLSQPSVRRTALVRSHVQPVVTYGLIALNVLMYVATVVQSGSVSNNQYSGLFQDLAMWGPLVRQGEVWRMGSSTFLHYGLTHVAVNMISLFIIGRDIEQVLGKWRYLLVYLLAGLGGSVAVLLFTPNAVVAGASGSVFGLLGAAGVIMLRNKQNMQPLIGILVLNAVISFMPGISLAAHLGGLLVGAALTFLLVQLTPSRR